MGIQRGFKIHICISFSVMLSKWSFLLLLFKTGGSDDGWKHSEDGRGKPQVEEKNVWYHLSHDPRRSTA